MMNVGNKVTEMVGNHFMPPEKVDESKILQDNFYSFNQRRAVAQYHIYFYDYRSAEDVLNRLLKDELAFYGI